MSGGGKCHSGLNPESLRDRGGERIRLLFRDRDIAVISKPAGLLSVPYPGGPRRTAQRILEGMLAREGVRRVYAVHRLDRDTSGVMMFALNEGTRTRVMRSWRTIVTERLYRAVAELPPGGASLPGESGEIVTPFAQNAYHRGYVPREDSPRPWSTAVTHYRVIAHSAKYVLLELSLDTGRKNQIRAQLAYMNCPIAGDAAYRAATDPFGRLALHARTLAFTHPATGEALRFEVPESASWERAVRGSCRRRAELI